MGCEQCYIIHMTQHIIKIDSVLGNRGLDSISLCLYSFRMRRFEMHYPLEITHVITKGALVVKYFVSEKNMQLAINLLANVINISVQGKIVYLH